MAAALALKHAPDWDIYSAGVQTTDEHVKQGINKEAKASLAKVGVEMSVRPLSWIPRLPQLLTTWWW